MVINLNEQDITTPTCKLLKEAILIVMIILRIMYCEVQYIILMKITMIN